MEHLLDQMLYYEYQDAFAEIYGYSEWGEALAILPDKDFEEFEHIFNTERFYCDEWIPKSYERLRKTPRLSLRLRRCIIRLREICGRASRNMGRSKPKTIG